MSSIVLCFEVHQPHRLKSFPNYCNGLGICCCIQFVNTSCVGLTTVSWTECGNIPGGSITLGPGNSYSACVYQNQYTADPCVSVFYLGCCDSPGECIP